MLFSRKENQNHVGLKHPLKTSVGKDLFSKLLGQYLKYICVNNASDVGVHTTLTTNLPYSVKVWVEYIYIHILDKTSYLEYGSIFFLIFSTSLL